MFSDVSSVFLKPQFRDVISDLIPESPGQVRFEKVHFFTEYFLLITTFFHLQQPRVNRYNHRTGRHQYRTNSRT
jgi:hypothetical protein